MSLHRDDPTSPTLLNSVRAAPNDPVAWKEFLSRYEPLMRRWCASWGLQDSDVNDVCQDVLMRLAKAMRTFEYDPGSSFRAWLKTVTKHAWIDWGKQLEKPGSGHGDTGIVKLINSVEARDDLSRRLEDEYDAELMELALLRVQMAVSPQKWKIFELTALEGLKGAEVADRLNIQVAHVYVARSQVKNAVQAELRRLEACSENQINVSHRN